MTPTVYLISRNLTDEQIQRLRDVLSITPLAALIVADVRDADTAEKIRAGVTYLKSPIAILADFTEPLTALNTDGKSEVINLE